jgi:hypothetical protein
LELENGNEVKVALQSELDPVQTQAEKAFVYSVDPINQACFVGCDHPQALAYHPDISQTSCDQHAAQTDRIR